jgi:hypothetical protein
MYTRALEREGVIILAQTYNTDTYTATNVAHGTCNLQVPESQVAHCPRFRDKLSFRDLSEEKQKRLFTCMHSLVRGALELIGCQDAAGGMLFVYTLRLISSDYVWASSCFFRHVCLARVYQGACILVSGCWCEAVFSLITCGGVGIFYLSSARRGGAVFSLISCMRMMLFSLCFACGGGAVF